MEVGLTERLDSFVKNHSNRQLVAISLSLFIVSVCILGYMVASTGSPVKLGMEFKGGILVSVASTESAETLKAQYSDYPINDARETGSRVVMQFGPMSNEEQNRLAKQVTSAFSSVEIKQIGPVYGESLQKQAVKALLLSFLGMAVVVFLIFKKPIPAGTVVFSAISDLTIAIAFMNVVGIELSLGTVAALLMLIGYSVDSNILLTTRVLKRTGTVNENVSSAMKTGITMTTTTLVALIAMYLVSTYSYIIVPSFSQIPLLSSISIVLIFGLLADIINTWLLNVSVLRWYVTDQKGRKA